VFAFARIRSLPELSQKFMRVAAQLMERRFPLCSSACSGLESRDMRITLQVLFYLASVSAAVLWWWSAGVTIPVPTYEGLGPHGDFMKPLIMRARLNAWAAGTTGAAAMFSFLREFAANSTVKHPFPGRQA
jgi:hypothetical protein